MDQVAFLPQTGTGDHGIWLQMFAKSPQRVVMKVPYLEALQQVQRHVLTHLFSGSGGEVENCQFVARPSRVLKHSFIHPSIHSLIPFHVMSFHLMSL